MFAINGDTIYLTRGDKATINLSIEDYQFKVGDSIEFRVYNKKRLDEPPVLKKEITVEEGTDSISISLTAEETKIGTALNKTVTYWYEIELNDEQTIIGFDENGAKELILYPEGAEDNDIS